MRKKIKPNFVFNFLKAFINPIQSAMDTTIIFSFSKKNTTEAGRIFVYPRVAKGFKFFKKST